MCNIIDLQRYQNGGGQMKEDGAEMDEMVAALMTTFASVIASDEQQDIQAWRKENEGCEYTIDELLTGLKIATRGAGEALLPLERNKNARKTDGLS